ncbi:hydroxylysine kinase-like isoform X2 [Lissotriton helveticus]
MSSTINPSQTSYDVGKPALSDTQATLLVEDVFGLKVSKIKPLPSYGDQNFHIVTTDLEKTTNVTDFVLKITNCIENKIENLIDVQTRVMMFLRDEGFPTATAVPTRDGQILSLQSADYGLGKKDHVVRLMTYLPGVPLAKIPAGPDLLYEVGQLAAKLDKALQKFSHPNINTLDRGSFIWNLSQIPLLKEMVFALDQQRHQEVVEQTILEFEKCVLQELGDFRRSINHGDLNDYNILLQQTSKESFGKIQDTYRISGILDFNDMSNGYYAFEVAIAIMYMMIESQEPLKAGGYVLAGFESILPLNQKEKDALYLLVMGRCVQSLVIARHSVLQHPENEEYLMITAKTGWKHLLTMAELGKEAVEKIWFDTAKEYSECK